MGLHRQQTLVELLRVADGIELIRQLGDKAVQREDDRNVREATWMCAHLTPNVSNGAFRHRSVMRPHMLDHNTVAMSHYR